MRRLLTLFIAMSLFLAPAFSQKKDTYRVRTVVIDPGHGGAKPGAQGGRSQEKNITLAIAKKFGKLVSDNYPDVKVIFTRTTDVDISLAERAHIANRNKADLFISIHANSHPTAAPTGVETFVMGLSESRANLEVAKKENADILLESDYKNNEAYKGFDPNAPESFVMLAMFQNSFIDKSLNFAQAIQNQYKLNLKTINRGVKQAELFVLYKTTCPSVLTEVGFISNPTEEAFMLSDEGQAKIALSLFNAFMNFKATEEGTNKIANPKIDLPGYAVPEKEKPAESKAPVAEAEAKKSTPAPSAKNEEAPAEVAKKETIVSPQRPVPTRELAPRMEIATDDAPQSTPQEAQKPVAKPATQPSTSLSAPVNTAAADTDRYYTVQFLTSAELLPAGSPAFKGLEDVEMSRSGQLYCYSVGRFATFTEASNYSREVRRHTPFNDAWAVMRKVDKAQQEPKAQEQPKAEPTKQEAPKPEAPKQEVVKQEQPKQEEPKQPEPKQTTVLPAPKNTGSPNKEYFTVQFLISTTEFHEGDTAFKGLTDVIVTRNGNLYCYSVGCFATFNEANQYATLVRQHTPFADAWALRRTLPSKQVEPQQTAAPQEKPKTEAQQVAPAQPKTKTLAAEDKGTHYRIQFLTTNKVLQAGNPDLHGIRDFRYSQSGRFYIYSCGNYTSLAEARKRLATIKSTTPFKDAFIFGTKNGRRFNIE